MQSSREQQKNQFMYFRMNQAAINKHIYSQAENWNKMHKLRLIWWFHQRFLGIFPQANKNNYAETMCVHSHVWPHNIINRSSIKRYGPFLVLCGILIHISLPIEIHSCFMRFFHACGPQVVALCMCVHFISVNGTFLYSLFAFSSSFFFAN